MSLEEVIVCKTHHVENWVVTSVVSGVFTDCKGNEIL